MSDHLAKKTAIILFNLGGPDRLESVKPFLFNLFNDKYIIKLPSFFRRILAWVISTKREKTAKIIYSKMGGKSTILPQTENQANALTDYLKGKIEGEYKIFICMRHWHPMSSEVIKNIENYGPSEVILLPLYPQFSTTTTASSINDFISKKEKSLILKKVTTKAICCYPTDKNFAKSHAELLYNTIKKLAAKSKYIVLFSAHGLPKKIIDAGDPYQWQVEESVNAVIDKMPVKDFNYKITYQSKVGPLEWIGPSTEDEISLAAKNGLNIVIVPIAFVSEHSETLVELDLEYKEIALLEKVQYYRIPTLSMNEYFIKSLGDIITNFSKKADSCIFSANFDRLCPNEFSACPCKK